MAKRSAWAAADTPRTVTGLPNMQKTPKGQTPEDVAMQKEVLKILSETTDAVNKAWEKGNDRIRDALKNYAGGPYHLGATAAGVAGSPVASKRKLVFYVCHTGSNPAPAASGISVGIHL